MLRANVRNRTLVGRAAEESKRCTVLTYDVTV